VFAEYGQGPYLFDIDMNRYIDLVMGLMPLVLGYVDILGWKSHQIPVLSLPHPLEVELSELLCEIIPCAEMVRLGKNGSDATTAAVRLARSITGKNKVIACGYHGWHDWSIGRSWRNSGVPFSTIQMTVDWQYNEPLPDETLGWKAEEIACVIMEPVKFDLEDKLIFEGDRFVAKLLDGEIHGGGMQKVLYYLEHVRKWCDKHGALLIFDEMITGFRFDLGGAQKMLGITPDLACFGKAMANGWPISAVVGREKYMRKFKDIHFSTTFGGEVLSIAAAIATIRFMKDNDVVGHLWMIGGMLKKGIQQSIEHHNLQDFIKVEGYDVWPRLQFLGGETQSNLVRSFFSQECIARGVLVQENLNLSYAHKVRHIEKVLSVFVFDEVMQMLADEIDEGGLGPDLIKGQMIKPRMRIR
jgi:glutamate-1-semialdehyde 2,1-aminomutase/spore coat polysaccharide biosynthesis protein SpsF